jgi:hypothetical protein
MSFVLSRSSKFERLQRLGIEVDELAPPLA